jgi:hypothetical protein
MAESYKKTCIELALEDGHAEIIGEGKSTMTAYWPFRATTIGLAGASSS